MEDKKEKEREREQVLRYDPTIVNLQSPGPDLVY